jgi:hypothetical protein
MGQGFKDKEYVSNYHHSSQMPLQKKAGFSTSLPALQGRLSKPANCFNYQIGDAKAQHDLLSYLILCHFKFHIVDSLVHLFYIYE